MMGISVLTNSSFSFEVGRAIREDPCILPAPVLSYGSRLTHCFARILKASLGEETEWSSRLLVRRPSRPLTRPPSLTREAEGQGACQSSLGEEAESSPHEATNLSMARRTAGGRAINPAGPKAPRVGR